MRCSLARAGSFVLATCVVSALLADGRIELEVRPAALPYTVVAEADEGMRIEIPVVEGSASVPVELDVVLISDFPACESGTRLCEGVQGYSIVVATDASFHLRPNPLGGDPRSAGASFAGTLSDDYTNPPGVARPPILRYVDVVDPAKNDGQEGAVGACVLGFQDPVILPPIGEHPILKLRGDFDVSGLSAGDATAPCLIDIRDAGDEGLVGFGVSVTTQMTVLGNTHGYVARDLEIVLTIVPPAPFRRGDSNDDGRLDVSDVLFTLNWLFLGSREPSCIDGADTDDNGRVELTDGITIFEYLFFGAEPPPAPGPRACGSDPTPDGIVCRRFDSC